MSCISSDLTSRPQLGAGGRSVLLVSPVGFAQGWAPMNIQRLQSYLEATQVAVARTLSLCLRFTRMVAQTHPDLAEFDRDMGEWGSSFHALYFGAKYFSHADPGALIRSAVMDSFSGRDFFRTEPWRRRQPTSDLLIDWRCRELIRFCELIEDFSEREIMRELTSRRYDVVGFSVNAQQVMSAACLARRVRSLLPEVSIVFGGPAVLARTAPRYRELFPEVDYFVHGDGEQALASIVTSLGSGIGAPIRGVLDRSNSGEVEQPAVRPSVDEAAPLQYDEESSPFLGVPLTTWFGRGCSWGKCTFCAIPDQQRRLDNRPPRAVYHEVVALQKRHGTTRFRFGDWEVNGSRKDLMEFCQLVIQGEHRFEFWAEVNARNLDEELVKAMKAAGFVSLQVGLEAFSDSLLRKLRKPATVVDNVACMKLVQQHGIDLFSNLIMNAPDEIESDVQETIRILPLIRHLLREPVTLSALEFLMEFDADAYRNRRDVDSRTYDFERRCFPEDVEPPVFLNARTGGPSWLWAVVERELEHCAAGHFELTHIDDGEVVLIRDTRQALPQERLLTGAEAAVYRAIAGAPRSVGDMVRLGPEQGHVEGVIDGFVASGLAIRSGRRAIGLSVPTKH